MNKEEAIETIIEEAKRGNRNAHTDFCEKYATCRECPLCGDEGCRNILFNRLIELLPKVKEKKETNLEHYFEDSSFTDGTGYIIKVRLPLGLKTDNATKWLLSPYEEPPKPKFKLTQFEYDLLNCYHVSELGIKDYWILDHMHKKGYFKNVPTDVFTEDILNNCEVVEE